jgi:DNA-binding GntR family transcriptional regulator
MQACILKNVTASLPPESPAAERVYAQTKESILSGQIPGGTLLSEAEVARRLEVSRTPAREAFVRLAAEGLLSLLPRRGAVVTPLAPTDAVDVLEVRHALETAAVSRLARLDTPSRTYRLSAAAETIETQAACLAADDISGFITADEQFHFQLVKAAHNNLAITVYATLGDRQRRMTALAISVNGERLAHFVPEHRQLLELARRGDPAGFSATLTDHLRSTHAVLAPSL